MKFLLAEGADVCAQDLTGFTPLHVIAKFGCRNAVQHLLENGAIYDAVDMLNRKPQEMAAFVNLKSVQNETPLHYAVWKGYVEIVNILLQNGANPNLTGKNGCTPLHYAVKYSFLNIAKALLASGAVYDVVDYSGKKPLDFSEDKSITNVLQLLSKSFKNIKDGNSKFIHDLNKVKDISTIKAIMCAKNSGNETLVVFAMEK
ncbi:LOW QUALITY PROTEIN: putative ankyrin repeat protein RF_1087 [Uloborus diversus]|uniref:LOW QUALITY PROTEIN: putative ankyrin repeat protein RF_1087 n=1 Tax=Uloborus diversus TaxID=327109 RepID=UPI00240A6F58|nr:LOW QUALITY PROTEIN: putative ankyrin repeat protein RF_1087 [Uloborus diversus]